MKRTHRLLSLLLTFLMVWALLPTAVFAEDTRTVITGITAVGADKPVRPEYGERITIPSFRVIDGEPAYFFTDNYDSKWEKKEGDTWRAIPLYSSETFTEGVYRFSCQVRISMKETFNGKNAATHKLPQNGLIVRVDNQTWSLQGDASYVGNNSYQMVTSPEYTVKLSYPLTYDLGGGQWNTSGSGYTPPTKYVAGEALQLPTAGNITKDNSQFVGWYENKGDYWLGPYTSIAPYQTGAKALVARWQDSGNTSIPVKGYGDAHCEVRLFFTAMWAGLIFPVEIKVDEGYTYSFIAMLQPQKRNLQMTFLSSGRFNVYTPEEVPAGSSIEITVRSYPRLYAISYELNGGEKTNPSDWGSDAGTTCPFPGKYTVEREGFELPTEEDVHKDGYRFVGWYTNPEFQGEPVTAQSVGETGDKTYYAKWQEITYNISVKDSTNGTVTASKTTAPRGDTIEVTTEPARGYRLKSLSYTADEGKTYTEMKDHSFVMPEADVEIRGEFEKDPFYEYTIDITGGSAANVAGDAITTAKEGAIVTLTAAIPAGKAFVTWAVESGDVTVIEPEKAEGASFVMPAADVKICGVFDIANPFVDVPADSYYEKAVLWAVEKDITRGTTESTFSPEEPCTRGQAVTFLWRAAGSPEPKSAAMPFDDVTEGSYYFDAVRWAVEEGITKGTSATEFSPDAVCSRGQIVTFLWRSQKMPPTGTENPFTDVSADAYYCNAVLWAVQQKVTMGTDTTTFSPEMNCTRAQIVTFLWRALGE